jgi:competence protein ComEC
MRLTRERALLLTLLVANAIVWVLAFGSFPRPLTITVIDVGQGDSILVQAPSGRTMLIDGGGRAGEATRGYDVGREVVVPALMARGVRRIDVLVVTHPHEDHIGGLGAVVAALPVGMVLDPMLAEDNEQYRELRAAIKRKHISVHRATEGQQLDLGDGVLLEVLNPPDPRLMGASANDSSVVMRLTSQHFSMLLTADIEHLGAVHVARLGDEIRSTVLKVPHHGSAGDAGSGLVQTVRPALAVISVGENNQFGHPSPETLRELEAVGAKVMRTDRDGAVTTRVRGDRWWAEAYTSRAKASGNGLGQEAGRKGGGRRTAER